MNRILTNTSPTLTHTFYEGETKLDLTTVTVTVTRDDGTVLVSAASATENAATLEWSYTLPIAHTSRVDVLEVVWTANTGRVETDYVEVSGGFYVTLKEIRDQPDLADTAKFPTAKLEAARSWFEDLAESHCGYAFVPRYAREEMAGSGKSKMMLSRLYPRALLSVTKDDVAQTTTDWTLEPYGVVAIDTGTFSSGSRWSFAYEHGLREPPSDVKQAALTAIRGKLLADRGGVPSRELSIRDEFGTVTRLAVAAEDRPSGWPEVDAVLNRHRVRIPVVVS